MFYQASTSEMYGLVRETIDPYRDCPQPIREEFLLTGPLEPTDRAYAIAKIAGIELCRSYNRQFDTQFLSAMPTNLYGPGDNYDLNNSHVLPALIRRVYEAERAGRREVVVIQRLVVRFWNVHSLVEWTPKSRRTFIVK